MKILFDKSFLRDIQKISDEKLKSKVIETLDSIERANSLSEIPNLRKMKGHATACRIRVGDYRIGLYKENDSIKLIRFMNRKDIYKYFP